LLARQGVHIAGVLAPGGKLEHVTLQDEYGPVTFWLMPYLFPALAARALED
jgi:exonuclease SbcD